MLKLLAPIISLVLASLAFAAPTTQPTISVSNAVVSATGTSATFTVSISAPATTPVTVHYATLAGTASSGAGDYIGIPAGTVTIPAGKTSAIVTIAVKPHTGLSAAKTFSLTATASLPVTVDVTATGTATIQPATVVKADPVTQPATQPTTQPAANATVIQPTDNLVAKLNAATAGQCFKLVSGQTYSPPGQQVSTKVGWSLDATSATLNWQVPPATASSCIRAGYNGVHIVGGTWKTNAIVIEILAQQCSFTDATTVDGATQAVKIDAFGGNSGTGAIVARNAFGKTNSVTVYTSQDCQILNNRFAASIGEVSLRVSPSDAGVTPGNVVIDSNELFSIGGANLKGCCELRQCRGRFTNNICHDYVRVGQGTATSNAQYATIVITGNKWPGMPPTSVQQHLMLMAGVTATVSNNDFAVDSIMETASISAPSNVVFSGNRRHPIAADVVPRSQLWNPMNNRASGIPVDGGGNVVVPFGGK